MWARAQFKFGAERVAQMWQYNEQGHQVLSSLRMEYEDQCHQYAQHVRATADANSSQTVNAFGERAEGLMSELTGQKLTSRLLKDDTEHLKLEIEDREGQLMELQQEGAVAQASTNAAPGVNIPPGLLVPNGNTIGHGTDTGTGQRTADEWWATRAAEYVMDLSVINPGPPTFGARHYDIADNPPTKSPGDGGPQNTGPFPGL